MSPPPCRRLGIQCRALKVTLRVGTLEGGDDPLDHEATWLLGHTERMTFGELWVDQDELYVEATLHVPCRHLEVTDGRARCRALGFRGRPPREPVRPAQARRLGGERFRVVEGQRPRDLSLELPARGRRPRDLPVLPSGPNPCEGAPCRTADNRVGAACCRDLSVEIMCERSDTRLEALVRARQSPYLCKVERDGDHSLEAELISACDYLEPGGVACTLHGRVRADGRTAKPALCFDWPPKRRVIHRGCAFATRWQRAQHA